MSTTLVIQDFENLIDAVAMDAGIESPSELFDELCDLADVLEGMTAIDNTIVTSVETNDDEVTITITIPR